MQVCPKCGGKRWKQIPKAGGMVGFEKRCSKCKYQGTFFEIDKKTKIKKAKVKKALKKKKEIKTPQKPWVLIAAIILILLIIIAMRFNLFDFWTPMTELGRYILP